MCVCVCVYVCKIILNIVHYPRFHKVIMYILYVGILYIRSYFYICKLWFCGIVYSSTSVILSLLSNARGPIFYRRQKIGVKIESSAPVVSMIKNLTFYPIICLR